MTELKNINVPQPAVNLWYVCCFILQVCFYSCLSQRSNYSCVSFSRQRHSERVLLIEILQILLISVRVEKQDLETVTGEMGEGISWPWWFWRAAPSPLQEEPQPSPVGASWNNWITESWVITSAPAGCPSWEEWGSHGGIYTTSALLVIMTWISLPGKDPEQFLQLPSHLCSGHGKCEVEESKARFWW